MPGPNSATEDPPADPRHRGVVYTPRPLCRLMVRTSLALHLEVRGVPREAAVRLATADPADLAAAGDDRDHAEAREALADLTVLDPAAGTGNFLLEAAERLGALADALDGPLPAVPLAGVDPDGEALDEAADRLDGLDIPLDHDLVRGDAALGAPLRAEVPPSDGPYAPEWFPAHADPGFALVTANPPYVRHERIGPPGPDRPETEAVRYKRVLSAAVAPYHPEGEPAPGRADLAVPIVARALAACRPDGFAAFVVPASWLQARYGRWVRRILSERLVCCCEPASTPAFGEADVHPVVLFCAGEPAAGPVRFVRLREPAEPGAVARLVDPADRPGTLRVDRTRLDPDLSWAGWPRAAACRRPAPAAGNGSEPPAEGNGPGGAPGPTRPARVLGAIREAPSARPVESLGDLAYGKKTGAVDFFYLDEETIGEFGIEERYVGRILSTTRSSRTIRTTGDRPLFDCREGPATLQGTGALAYIRHGEAQGIDARRTVRAHRPRWYSLDPSPVDLALPQFWDRTFRVLRLDPPCPVANNCWGLALDDGLEPWRAVALLNSTLLFCQVEMLGRTNQAQGVLTTYGPELRALKIPDPARLPADLRPTVEALSDREVADVFTEYGPDGPPDRRTLDEAVFEVAGLDADDLAEARRVLRALVADRLARSRRGEVPGKNGTPAEEAE